MASFDEKVVELLDMYRVPARKRKFPHSSSLVEDCWCDRSQHGHTTRCLETQVFYADARRRAVSGNAAQSNPSGSTRQPGGHAIQPGRDDPWGKNWGYPKSKEEE